MVRFPRWYVRTFPLMLITMLVVLCPAAAYASNSVIDTDPRPRTESQVQPGRVTVAFEQDLPASGATIVVQNANGKDVTNGAYSIVANNIYTDLVYPLPRGTYTVHYRVEEDNGTPFGGTFKFAYGRGDFPRVDPGSQPSKHVTTWRGDRNIPDVLSLESDIQDSSAPSATPTPPDAKASPTPADLPEDDNNRASNASVEDSDGIRWFWYALGAVLVASCTAGLIVLKRR